QLFSRWVGDTEKGIREIFRKARQVAPCVVFLDEIDALAPARSDGAVDRVGERAVGQLLAELDGLEELRGVTVLAATNRRDRLDTALLRAGRFDLHLEVPLPDDRARQQILAIHLHREKLCLAVDLVDVSRRTAGWSGADLALLCRRALMNLLRRTVQAGHVEHSQLCLEEVDLQAAWREVQLYGCGAFGTGRHN
ncbi:MAG: AAA family ATPase, partial [Bacillota bacterium]